MANWSQVLVVLGVLVSTAVAASLSGSQTNCPHRSRLPDVMVQKCGKDLSNYLEYICKPYGGLNGPSSKEKAEYTGSGRPIGIVDECCKKACSHRTLFEYCKNSTQEAPALMPMPERGDNEEEADDNRLKELVYGPPTPQRQKRFKTGSCVRRCRSRCEKRVTLMHEGNNFEDNKESNLIQRLGTVSPHLQRFPVIHPWHP